MNVVPLQVFSVNLSIYQLEDQTILTDIGILYFKQAVKRQSTSISEFTVPPFGLGLNDRYSGTRKLSRTKRIAFETGLASRHFF